MFGNEESNAMRDFYHLVIVSDVVVDPHSPARVNLGCRFSKWLKKSKFSMTLDLTAVVFHEKDAALVAPVEVLASRREGIAAHRRVLCHG